MIDPGDPPVLGGKYQLERELGRGGSATVFLARDTESGQRVALKLLSEELAHGAGMERFSREIRVMMRLRHPHILPVLDSGTADGRPYYVMPYFEIETLSQRLDRERQLSVDEVKKLAANLCAALGYAHEQGVLHRDVKPANVLLGAEGAYLTDFGLAFEAGALSGERITSSGIVAGTSAYMSPEQVSGERRLDHRTDIYSLGCVLYEALAGVRPFQGATEPAIRAMRLTSDPAPLRALRPGVPQHIEAAIARAMAREVADRWQNVAAFQRAVAEPTATMRPARRAKRSPGLALVAIVAIAIVAGALWKRAQNRSAPSARLGIVVSPRFDAGSTTQASVMQAARSITDVLARITKLDVRLDDPTSGTPRSRSRVPVAYTATVELRAPAGAPELWLTLQPSRERDATTRYSTALGNLTNVDSAAAALAIGALRTMAVRDSANLVDTRAAVLATTVPTALAQLLEAQRLFGQSDGEGAARALHGAIAADSGCALAVARLAMVYNWLHHYDSAATVVDVFVRRRQPQESMLRLLRGSRAFALGVADSAIDNYQRSVVDEPSNVDGWFGLAESLMHLGWRSGHAAHDAYTAYEAVARIDSGFAPMYYHVFDLALARGDTETARTFLSRIPAADPTHPSRRIALALATTAPPVRDSMLRALRGEVRRTLSELVLFYARHARSPFLADTIARALADSQRTPDDRLRGLRYRLVLAPALRRTTDAIAELGRSHGGRDAEDPWLASVVLAGLADPQLIETQLRVARARLQSATPAAPLASPQDPLWQAGELLVACALAALSTCDHEATRRALARIIAQRGIMHAVVRRWIASLDARTALVHADTSRALTLLTLGQEGLRDTYVAFFPLASYPTHRLVQAQILCAMRSPRVTVAQRSFELSESLADAAFLHAPSRTCPPARIPT